MLTQKRKNSNFLQKIHRARIHLLYYSLFLGLLYSHLAQAQTQLWCDIELDYATGAGKSRFGEAVAMDGDRVVVGASRATGSNQGAVQVYELSGTSWATLGLPIVGNAGSDEFGHSVALEVNRLVVGAPKSTGLGYASVYQWSGSAWVQLGATITGEAAGDQFGFSVALSGNQLAIGAPRNDPTSAKTNAGHVRVYRWSGSAWVQLGADIDGAARDDQFGYSVAIAGNRLAVGARYNDGNGSNAGHVRVYEWSGSAWVQLGADIEGKSAGDQFGISVALEGDRLAAGASHNSNAGSLAGCTRVHDWDGSAWKQLGADINGEAAGDYSGLGGVALSGNRLAVGAPYNDGGGSTSGHVRLHEWDGSAWKQIVTDIDGVTGAQAGWGVAIQDNRVAVGFRHGNGNNGVARVYCIYSPTIRNLTVSPNPVCEGNPINMKAVSPSNQIKWYTEPTKGTSIASTASGADFLVTPLSTTTYYAEADSNGCPSIRQSELVEVYTKSTPPIATPLSVQCPNTNTPIAVSGGVAGTGSSVHWYTDSSGSGTALGTGNSIFVAAGTGGSENYYARREGTCNTTADAVVTVNARDYIYGLDGATSTTYCTDDNGWHHFYNSSNEILLSIQGNISGAPAGYPQVRIRKAGSHYQSTQGPFTVASCVNGYTPGEERFEMNRSWEVDFGGGTQTPPYKLRFYYIPSEKTAIDSAAANWMSTYGSCGYTYKYANPNGFYWFKDVGGARPHWDGLHHTATTGSVGSAPTNYAEWQNITSFSGGSGGIILVPDPLLNTEWLSFYGSVDGKATTLTWELDREVNTNYFKVLRSRDGLVFETIATVAAKGNSEGSTSYKYVDDQAVEGTSYYKIQLVYLDETTSATQLVSLTIDRYNTGYLFYPNPSNGKVYYQYKANARDNLTVELSDMLGRKLKEEKIVSQLGINNIPIELGGHPNGSYMIRVRNANTNNVHTSKIIKNR